MPLHRLRPWLLVLAILPWVRPATAHEPPASPPAAWLDDSLPWQEPADRLVDVQHLDLDVTVDLEQRAVHGQAVLRGVARPNAREVVLQATDLDLQEATWLEAAGLEAAGLGGAPTAVTAVRDGDDLRLPLPAGTTAWTVKLRWKAKPRLGMYFQGPTPDEPDRPRHAYTQGETAEARHWLPSPDDPDERLTWRVTVRAPAGLVALSNGQRVERQVQGPLAATTYAVEQPLPVYLLTVAVGPFQAVTHPHPRVALTTWVLPNQRADAERALQRTARILDALEAWTGVPYPFASYGQVIVTEFPHGGMENATLSTLSDRAVPDARTELDDPLDGLVAHELAHQWFGDLVTCRSWAELWLNEGGATYFAALTYEKTVGRERLDEGLWNGRLAYLAEAEGRQRALVSDRYRLPDELFDRHAYNKGAWVLHMLRRRLGDAAFFAGIRAYLQGHAWQSVETADLRRSLEAASGQSLRGFFRRWVEQPGHPQVSVRRTWHDQQLRLRFEQRQKITAGQPAFDLPIAIRVRVRPEDPPQRLTFRLTGPDGEWTWPAPQRPSVVEIDPDLALLMDLRVEAGPDDHAALLKHGSTAAVRLQAVKDLARDLRHRSAVEALALALRQDSSRLVRATAAKTLGRAERDLVRQNLSQALHADSEPAVRAAAAWALGELHDGAAWDALVRLARQDPSYEVQRSALRALAGIDHRKARDLLREAAVRPTQWQQVEGVALQLLAQLADPRDKDLIWQAVRPGRRQALREGAVTALAASGVRMESERPAIRAFLEGLLHEPAQRLRQAAAQALGVIGDPASRTPLLAAANRELHLRTSEAMRQAVEQLGKPLPVEQRLRRLEEQLERMRREPGREERKPLDSPKNPTERPQAHGAG